MSSPPLHSRFESEFPLVQELSPAPDPLEALRRFVDLPGVLLFDSVQRHPTLGRFSYLTADPFHWQEVDVPRFGEDPLVPLRGAMSDFAAPSVEGLPPFQGGAAGMLGYEIGGVWERLRGRERSRLDVPAMAVGLYDSVIAWDHSANRAWIVSQGFPERNFEPRRRRAAARLEWMRERLTGTPRAPRFSSGERIIPEMLLHRHRLGDCNEVWSTFSRESYIASVQRIIDYIRAGDLFQANLSQQLLSLTNR
jgi:para-aminobenzoate synthetase component 1